MKSKLSKRWLSFVSVTAMGGILSAIASGCSSGSSNSSPAKILTGKAAIGAYFPDGSVVELRGAATVPSPDPSASPSVSSSLAQPSQVLTTTVQGNAGNYSVDVSNLTAPYLVRVKDASSGTWYYSYTDGTQLVANANPYTDLLVRSWYTNAAQIGGNPANINIDDVFASGVYPNGAANIVSLNPSSSSGTLPDGTPIALPDPAAMAQAGTVLSATVSRDYLIDLENVLTTNWVPGEGFDSLLDSVGVASLKPVIDSSLTAFYSSPSAVESALLYTEVVMTQTGTSAGTQSVQLIADVYSQATTIQVKDARQGYGQTVSFTTSSNGTDTHFLGSLALSGLPALSYEMMLDGNVYSTTHMTAGYYGTMTLNPDGSVASFVPGAGAVVNSATSSGVQYSISDLTPINAQITAHGSPTVLFEKTYARGSTWSGSDVLSYDTAGQAFDLHLVGANGERTVVQYSP